MLFEDDNKTYRKIPEVSEIPDLGNLHMKLMTVIGTYITVLNKDLKVLYARPERGVWWIRVTKDQVNRVIEKLMPTHGHPPSVKKVKKYLGFLDKCLFIPIRFFQHNSSTVNMETVAAYDLLYNCLFFEYLISDDNDVVNFTSVLGKKGMSNTASNCKWTSVKPVIDFDYDEVKKKIIDLLPNIICDFTENEAPLIKEWIIQNSRQDTTGTSLVETFRDRCGNCLNRTAKLSKCSGCHTVRYCNRLCQSSVWKNHKKVCEFLRLTRTMDTLDRLVEYDRE
jgi:hypothetical protein